MKLQCGTDTGRLIVRHTTKDYLLILCPRGRVLETHKLTSTFGGSALEAELGSYQAGGRLTRWHRLAALCQGALPAPAHAMLLDLQECIAIEKE